MSWLDRSEHQLEGGYWGEVTSTLLWCEQKYQWSKYLAEPVNSLTNALFLACAAYAMYRVHTERLHARFYGCALGVGAVGVGSLLFHMTLKHEAQLLDELPMIWASSFLTWSFLDQTLFLGTRIDRRVLPAIIFALNVWITVTYMSNGDPVFHQVAYASIMVVSILHAIYILTHPKAPLNTSDSARRRRREARSLEFVGTVLFIVGFGIWNVDNIFCAQLRAARAWVGYPWAILLEGHGWWHVFTCFGAYLLLVACEVLAMSYLEHPDNFVVVYGRGLPYLARVRAYDPHHTLLRDYTAARKQQ